MSYPYQMGGQQNPAMKYEMQDTSVPMAQPITTTTIIRDRPRWSWCSVVTASISLCCCTLFGFIGVMCSVFSYVDHKSGDYDRSSHKRKCSYGWSITAIVLGSLGFIGFIIIYAVFWNQIMNPGYYG